ncbi:MAG: tetratricopeptide repeat protein [Melioribacter sp.]|nr:tetratricopeptide repeat protein [Melioribacter sp.]
MKTIIRFFIYQLIIATIFNVFVEKSILKAQPKYFNISICKMHKELQDKGNGKCATCNNSVSSSSKRAKICEECWVKEGGLWNIGCYFCKENTVGGDYARVCSDCAAKDECVVCKKKLHSGDDSNEDGRRIVDKYTIQITIPGQKEKFQEYLNSATNAMTNQEYEQAITYFKKCNEIIPHGMDCNIGVALRELKREEEALPYFDSAIKDDPTWADPYGEKGITLAYLGRWNDAGPLFKKSIDLKYDSPTVYWMYGKYIEEILKKPSEAIPYYEKVIAKNPKSYKLYNNIGDIYFNEEKYDDAERAYKKVLEHDKNDFNALAFSGEINFKKQNFEEALKYYLLSHKIKPDNLELNYHMGICYGYLNQLENAESHFKHALSLNPNLTDVSLELARLYKSYGVYAKAIPIYEKLISDDVVTHAAYLDLALCHYMNKQYEDVIQNSKKFIEKETGNYPDPYKWMAIAAARLNEKQEAEKYCNKAIELNVENQSEIFYFVAAAYSLMNNSDKALLYLEKAINGGMPKESPENDSEFDNIKNLQAYKNLIGK